VESLWIKSYPQFIHIAPWLIHRVIHRFSTGQMQPSEGFSDFSTGSTHHKKKSDKIYSVKFNSISRQGGSPT
jgi:hypothetical protein